MMENFTFHLFLFTTNRYVIADALRGGVSGFIIDWENKGKVDRQSNADTQINYDTIEDLRRVRSLTDRLVICRINKVTKDMAYRKEIDMAVDTDVDEILLPMVQTVEEVEDVLHYVNERCGVGILIETMAGVQIANKLGNLPLSRVYVGLNDLAIDRGRKNIFDSLEDGTIDYVRQYINVPFGFAGLTLPECGYPIPCRLLIIEMARLGCSFSFLRRSFFADSKGKDLSAEILRIHESIHAAFKSSEDERMSNRLAIQESIRNASAFFNNKKLPDSNIYRM
jgi:hypothetical protein